MVRLNLLPVVCYLRWITGSLSKYLNPPAFLAGGFFFGMLTEIVFFVAQKSYERVY